MSKRDKLRRKLRNNAAEGSMREVQTLLQQFGFILVRTRGSHHIFEYDDGERFKQIVVPLHGRSVKKVYIQRIIEVLDELFPMESIEDDDGKDA